MRSLRMLPFRAAVQCRSSLLDFFPLEYGSIDSRTLERRVSPILASKNIHLVKVSTKKRCYVVGGSFERIVSGFMSGDTEIKSTELNREERCRWLTEVGNSFIRKSKSYWEGTWSLNNEIAEIPRPLWHDMILQMASKRRRVLWRMNAAATGTAESDTFPLCNSEEVLPNPSFEQCLSGSNSKFNRADMLICLRALKILEQIIFSRTKSVPGPLTVCLSVAGIVELTPSFKSVENALGMTTSYCVTERYRLRLISEREKAARGAWEDVQFLDETVIPSCQFDNWDILPLHAVKAEGKVMPKVNGSLLQSVARKRKRDEGNGATTAVKRQRTEWNPLTTHGDRLSFASSLCSPAKTKILEDSFDVVYGVVIVHREKLFDTTSATQPALQQPARSPESCAELRNRKKSVLTEKQLINFRSLLLSSFKPNGGIGANDASEDMQDVVYVDISRESAADKLTVRRMLAMIQKLLRPGERGCPRFVAVAGDQPSYKMIVEMWLESWRASKNALSIRTRKSNNSLFLHEWLVPFPGFFHAEKQAMYSICKELLHGVGLHELADCSGLSDAQVRNVLKHSHARDNQAFLFSLTCALVIHTIDIVAQENPQLDMEMRSFREGDGRNEDVVTDSGEQSVNVQREQLCSGITQKTVSAVSDDVIEIGGKVRKAVQNDLCDGPNGNHFIGVVLFGALLPTVGFHVLSRTGHTDVTEAFLFRLTYILHASNHLKYQELSLFYAFLRGILPPVVAEELHENTLGSSVMKLPSFTSAAHQVVDNRAFVHWDEALEMLIVRHLKSLSFNFIAHLENAAAWLMQVSRFRSLCRRISGASRAYGRFRGADDAGADAGPLHVYDRNAPHSRSVGAMLRLMRERGFLNSNHRGSEWLTNVFSSPPMRMNIMQDQRKLLNIQEHGRITTALHASVLFPEVFGKLTNADREQFFEGRKFKKWTTSRLVQTAAHSMQREGGSVSIAHGGMEDMGRFSTAKNRSRNFDVFKMLNEKRREISKAKDRLHLAQCEAERIGDEIGRRDASSRWNNLHMSRHLLSSRGNAFFDPSGSMCHASKSRMLKFAVNGGRAHV